MRTLIINATIIDGSGSQPRTDACVRIDDWWIAEVLNRATAPYDTSDVVIDARGGFVLPGLVNHHAHGLTRGPLMIVGQPPLPDARALANLDRQLSEGVTTALNVDGYATVEDATAMSKAHPMNLKIATLHTPAHNAWAVGGPFPFGGIAQRHEVSAEQMIARGAVAVGETGPGMDHHWWDYTLIPGAIQRLTGRRIDMGQASTLRQARSDTERIELFERWLDAGAELLGPWAETMEHVQAWADLSGTACDEAVDTAIALDVPLIFHHTPTTFELIRQAAQRHPGKVIAAHSNLQAADIEDAQDRARQLRAAGALIDVMTGDAFGARELYDTPEITFGLLQAGLVDLISTDYSAGFWDPMLVVVAEAANAGVLSVGDGIRMVTEGPAHAVAGLAPQRGRVAAGQVADLVITAPGNVADVRHVLISGVSHTLPDAATTSR